MNPPPPGINPGGMNPPPPGMSMMHTQRQRVPPPPGEDAREVRLNVKLIDISLVNIVCRSLLCALKHKGQNT